MTSTGIIRPSTTQALDLLGKWVVCKVYWGDGVDGPNELPHDTKPAQVVGVVVPAPGSQVSAQILMHDGDEKAATGGYQYELFLDTIQVVKILDSR